MAVALVLAALVILNCVYVTGVADSAAPAHADVEIRKYSCKPSHFCYAFAYYSGCDPACLTGFGEKWPYNDHDLQASIQDEIATAGGFANGRLVPSRKWTKDALQSLPALLVDEDGYTYHALSLVNHGEKEYVTLSTNEGSLAFVDANTLREMRLRCAWFCQGDALEPTAVPISVGESIIAVGPLLIDGGMVERNSSFESKVRFRYVSGPGVRIDKVMTSCGCTTASRAGTSVDTTSEIGEVKLTTNVQQRLGASVSALIQLSEIGSSTQRLLNIPIFAVCRPSMDIEPAIHRLYFHENSQTKLQGQFVVTCDEGRPFAVENIQVRDLPLKIIDFTAQPISDHSDSSSEGFIVNYVAELQDPQPGKHSGTIRVYTSDYKYKSTLCRAFFDLPSPVKCQPESIVLRECPGRTKPINISSKSVIRNVTLCEPPRNGWQLDILTRETKQFSIALRRTGDQQCESRVEVVDVCVSVDDDKSYTIPIKVLLAL